MAPLWRRPGPVAEQTEEGAEGDTAKAANAGEVAVVGPHSCPVAVNNTCCGIALDADKAVSQGAIGPFIRYWGIEHERSPSGGAGGSQTLHWTGSVLVVTKAEASLVVLKVLDAQGAVLQEVAGEELDTFHHWHCIRFMLRFPIQDQESQVRYNVYINDKAISEQAFDFYIAGWSQPVRWGFNSCNGFSFDVEAEKRENFWNGVGPLWKDVNARHKVNHLHLMVGGGDQLYCDDVWQCPTLKAFLDMDNRDEGQKEAKNQLSFSAGMQQEVNGYYFNHYCAHFSHAPIREAYSHIPQVMTWDDHDIFDGWGSYPTYLQSSKVFTGVFDTAHRWYCVFQQHCKPADKKDIYVMQLGRHVALIMPDQRHRRKNDQILPVEHYMELVSLCKDLPAEVEHVVFISTVPVVYPHLLAAQKVLNVAANPCVLGCLTKVGVNPMSQFKEPELMDDLEDHWTAKRHREERRFLIENLQMLAKYRGCRVTFISGDVHVCGAGYLISDPAPLKKEMLLHDYRHMHQIISSAIVNPPPPGGLMKVLDYFGKGGKINKHTKHYMSRLKERGHTTFKPIPPLMNKRNWCEVFEHSEIVKQPPSSRYPGQEEKMPFLTFTLRVEDEPGTELLLYDIVVPPLVPISGPDMERNYFDVHTVKIVERGLLKCLCGAQRGSLYEAEDEDDAT